MACVVKRRGKWVVDFRDHEGKRRWETYDTRKAADEALSKRIGEVKGRSYRAPADLPTFATVATAWLDGRRDRAKATIEIYAQQVENHLLPAFGALRIDHVTSEAVEQFRNEKRNSGLKPGTVNVLMQRIASMLKYAIKHQYVNRNAADSSVVERVRRQRVAERVAQAIDSSDVLTAEQAHALIEAAEPGLHRTFITTALLTGCRSGELLALTWGHVDPGTRKLRVSRSLSWDRSSGKGKAKPVLGPPKTDSSYRTLDMVPELWRCSPNGNSARDSRRTRTSCSRTSQAARCICPISGKARSRHSLAVPRCRGSTCTGSGTRSHRFCSCSVGR